MKILTVSELILKSLKKRKGWTAGGTLEREIVTTAKPSTVSRELRRLEEGNIIIKDYKSFGSRKTRYVVYRLK